MACYFCVKLIHEDLFLRRDRLSRRKNGLQYDGNIIGKQWRQVETAFLTPRRDGQTQSEWIFWQEIDR